MSATWTPTWCATGPRRNRIATTWCARPCRPSKPARRRSWPTRRAGNSSAACRPSPASISARPARRELGGPRTEGRHVLAGLEREMRGALLEERLDAFLRIGAGREMADALQVERHGVERVLRSPHA